MRLLKQIFIGITGLSIVIFFISLLLPSHIRVSKSILVNVPRDSVFSTLMNINDWKKWNPLLQDSTVKYSIEGTDQVHWNTKDGKLNTLQLQEYSGDSVMAVVLSAGKPVFTSGFNIVANKDNIRLTKVEWWVTEDIQWYPWEKFYGLFSESFKATYMYNTLQVFKQYLENKFISGEPADKR